MNAIEELKENREKKKEGRNLGGRPKGSKDSYQRTRVNAKGVKKKARKKAKKRKSRAISRPRGRPPKRFVAYTRNTHQEFHKRITDFQDAKLWEKEGTYNFMFRMPLTRLYIMNKLHMTEIRVFDIYVISCSFMYFSAQELGGIFNISEEVMRKRLDELKNKHGLIEFVGDFPRSRQYMGQLKEKRLYKPTHRARAYITLYYKHLLGILPLPDYF